MAFSPSRESIAWVFSGERTPILTALLEDNTMLFAEDHCEQMGVRIIAGKSGSTNGPPAESE